MEIAFGVPQGFRTLLFTSLNVSGILLCLTLETQLNADALCSCTVFCIYFMLTLTYLYNVSLLNVLTWPKL